MYHAASNEHQHFKSMRFCHSRELCIRQWHTTHHWALTYHMALIFSQVEEERLSVTHCLPPFIYGDLKFLELRQYLLPCLRMGLLE